MIRGKKEGTSCSVERHVASVNLCAACLIGSAAGGVIIDRGVGGSGAVARQEAKRR